MKNTRVLIVKKRDPADFSSISSIMGSRMNFVAI